MKKTIDTFKVIMLFVVLHGCSTSPDNNGGSNTTVVPLAPSNLTGSVLSTTKVSLSWTDNATNESGIKIERRLDGAVQFEIVGTVNADITSFTDSLLTPSSTYEYRVYAFNAVGNSITYSNIIVLTTSATITVPTIVTTGTCCITYGDAGISAEVTADGGSPVTSRGIVWSTNPSPTIALTTITYNGVGIGTFGCRATNLLPSTIYYLRPFATNNIGTSYGQEQVITTRSITQNYTSGPDAVDFDGNIYPSIIMSVNGCNWTTKNLNVCHYRNGDIIPQVTDQAQWSNLTTGAWCWYNNDSANFSQYGKLYNWYAVNDPRGLAPIGWHIPSLSDWHKYFFSFSVDTDTTTTLLGVISQTAGGQLKETGLSHWSPNVGATNFSGFTALGGGIRAGNFNSVAAYGFFWSASMKNNIYAWSFELRGGDPNLTKSWSDFKHGLSVRLVKD